MLSPSATHRTGLFWFTNDLRLEDNAALEHAATAVDQLVCLYIVDPAWFSPGKYGSSSIGAHRWRFLHQSLVDLQQLLTDAGQELLILHANPLDAIARIITVCGIDAVYRSQNAGYYEQAHWQTLRKHYPMISFAEYPTHTLFAEEALPFTLADFPASFSQFRKSVESLTIAPAAAAMTSLPQRATGRSISTAPLPSLQPGSESSFRGGPSYGNEQLRQYFASDLPGNYKVVRNELDGWQNSTKFSPWLANGSLSARQALQCVQDYELRKGANESTRHIVFELLWREFFQWYAHAHGTRLFAYSGIKRKPLLTSFYPERFKRWCEGSTPYPLVNACMKQLNATGYMSNRGRQIVASCLVNELALDWRFGAAYFEKQLIDYDMAANWGNWQYLAGVGADPRDRRHFNIDKQASLYDPGNEFVERWQGNASSGPMDSVDAADWPIGYT